MPIDIEIISPLKLQIAIRDYWDKDSSAVQIARAALRDVVGYPIRVDPEWLQLLGTLDTVYADRGALATAVAGCVEIWCKVFAELVEGAEEADDAQREWAEALMENLQPRIGLRLFVDVAEPSLHTKPGTEWSEDRAAFYLYLPAKQPVAVPSENAALYRGGLLRCFNEKEKMTLAEQADEKEREKEKEKKNDDWADIEMDKATGTAQVVDPTPVQSSLTLPARPALTETRSKAKSEYLPSVESLPRPDELFLRPPYHIIVSDYGAKKVIVQGSHGPSLNLLGEYMKRWCRINHQDSRKPAAVEVKYNQSCWAASPMHDQVTLTSEGNNIYYFNPTVVLAFIEGVLGYDLVSTEQGVWTYRRTEAFRS
ncbi:hypothetical protein F503_03834 [Ophiostoma piceae UAMH 11346]|uniref:Uncharacterized protein n=1 Tax=Ophiostoma piceae (strain UAMH 11346) TaxID=1262450 RepID=S3BVI9_OPHP1|nr:hypothetical protein F503_03834 [Ophiostoma piceae UAMH 11346]